MRKYLTTGLFGAILGIVIGGAPADASLISRSFLDEALTSYATTTALDLKANQSDLTTLSDTIGTPAELTYGDIIDSRIRAELFGSTYLDRFGNTPVPTNNISELINLNYTDVNFPGLAGVVYSLFWPRERDDFWPIRLERIFSDYEHLYNQGHQLFTGLIIDGGTLTYPDPDITVYGLAKLTEEVDKIPALTESVNANAAKIGTLPDGYETVGDALTAIKGIAEDAKAAALAAIPDPKTEGSTGKYVLTVDIVGDNATYRWEKIDREGEITTTTE